MRRTSVHSGVFVHTEHVDAIGASGTLGDLSRQVCQSMGARGSGI